MAVHGSAGFLHTIILSPNGSIWGFGCNEYHQLGFTDTDCVLIPTQIGESIFNYNIQDISCGYLHSACIDCDNNLYTFGSNSSKQLGISDETDSNNFIHLLSNLKVKTVSCGGVHTVCIDLEDNLWLLGKLVGATESISERLLIPKPLNVIFTTVHTGYAHTICRDSNGEYWSFGSNYCGQLGLNHRNSINNPTKIQNFNNIQRISVGYHHTAGLDDKGCLWVFGYNAQGELGLGHTTDIIKPTLMTHKHEIIKFLCGYFQTLFVDSTDTLYVIGNNNFLQLGIKTEMKTYSPIKFNTTDSLVIPFISGGHHTLCFENNYNILVFGRNNKGQLGINEIQEQIMPTNIPQENIQKMGLFQSRVKSARKIV